MLVETEPDIYSRRTYWNFQLARNVVLWVLKLRNYKRAFRVCTRTTFENMAFSASILYRFRLMVIGWFLETKSGYDTRKYFSR